MKFTQANSEKPAEVTLFEESIGIGVYVRIDGKNLCVLRFMNDGVDFDARVSGSNIKLLGLRREGDV